MKGIKAGYLVFVGFFLGIIIWIFDSFLDDFLLDGEPFMIGLFQPDPVELYKRLFVWFLLILFGAYVGAIINKRTKIEEKLRASENKYRTLIENIPQRIFLKNEKLEYVSCNDNYAHDISIRPDDIEGRTDYDFYPGDMAEKYRADDKRIMESGSAENIEEKYIQNGQELFVNTVKTPIRDESGRVTGILGVFWDITERKKAEEAVEKLQKQNKLILDSAGEGIYGLDTDGVVTFVNRAAMKLTGYEEIELLGKHSHDLIHHSRSDGTPFPAEECPVCISYQKGIVHHEYNDIFWRKDGKSLPVDYVSTPIMEKGEIVGNVVVFKDITERRSLEEMYRNIFDNASDAILTTDLENNITSWNRSAEKIFGWKAEEVTGKELFQLIAPSMLIEENRQIARDTLEGKTVTGLENVLLRKDGSSVYVNLTTSVLQDISKSKIGISFVIRDITELRKSEEIQIDKTRLMLANKAKTEFLAIMSHELRTPLNSIIGFSELLKQQVQGELKEKQKHYLDNIISSGRHLLNLINDILDLSRVESGKIELKIEKIPLHDAIEEAADLIKETASKNNVILKIEIDPKLEFLEADRQRLKQVLFNLLDNAVKFSKPEGGTVTLKARKAGNTAEFRVSDTGIGIKKEDIGKIFREFVQLESGSSRKYGGSGLGLSISKQLVELQGGIITAESRYGEGSTFAFSLPIIANGGK